MASIKVKQHDIKDCGAACLASIGNHYGVKLPIARIRQLANTDKRGTNVLGMIEAAEHMGFTAKGVKGDMDALGKIPLPAVAHIVVNKQLHHYVVVYKVTKNHVVYMDPAKGKMVKRRKEVFKSIWTGVLILFAKGDGFTSYNKKTSAFKRFWNLVQPHKTILIQALFGAMVFTVLGLAMSIYV